MDRKTRSLVEFLSGNPDPTTKDRERVKKDPNIKSQMQKIMGSRYPGQRQQNTLIAMVVGVLGFIVFVSIIAFVAWLKS